MEPTETWGSNNSTFAYQSLIVLYWAMGCACLISTASWQFFDIASDITCNVAVELLVLLVSLFYDT